MKSRDTAATTGPIFENFMSTVQLLKEWGADLTQTKLSAKQHQVPAAARGTKRVNPGTQRGSGGNSSSSSCRDGSSSQGFGCSRWCVAAVLLVAWQNSSLWMQLQQRLP